MVQNCWHAWSPAFGPGELAVMDPVDGFRTARNRGSVGVAHLGSMPSPGSRGRMSSSSATSAAASDPSSVRRSSRLVGREPRKEVTT